MSQPSTEQAAVTIRLRHDVMTALSSMLGYSELILSSPVVAAELKSWAKQTRQATVNLHYLATEGLELASEERWDETATIAHLRSTLHASIRRLAVDLEASGTLKGASAFLLELEAIRAASERLMACLASPRGDDESAARDGSGQGALALKMEAASTIRRFASAAAGSDRPAATILVVDDNPQIRELLRRTLTRGGHDVRLAHDGQEGLDLLARDIFDLVVLDVMMPNVNGYEVLLQMKADPALRRIPVIMVSAVREVDDMVRCIEVGADDFLEKPFHPTLLQARVNSCLEHKYARDREGAYLRQIKREKKRMDELFSAVFPPAAARELKESGEVVARRHEAVAVLFADLVGFTEYCERRDPQDVITALQEIVEAFEGLLSKWRSIQKIKTIGDGYMAAAGIARQIENPSLCLVEYGLEMVEVVKRMPGDWGLRVGVHVGPVVAGILGHRQYLYDLFGDTVNTAARMEQLGEVNTVTVTDQVWTCIEPVVEVAREESLDVKGKGQMRVHRVERLKPLEAREPAKK